LPTALAETFAFIDEFTNAAEVYGALGRDIANARDPTGAKPSSAHR